MSKLADLIAPVTVPQFIDQYRDRRWLISRDVSRSFAALFSWEQLESFLYIARPWERPAGAQTQLRLIGAGAPTSHVACIEDVAAALSAGATLNLNHVETQWLPARNICDALITELSVPVSSNLYCTPPNGAGFATHFDNQDVFILQIEGSKNWRIHPTEVHWPFVREGVDAVDAIAPIEADGEIVQLSLEPGDVLYLPRGTPHDATATAQGSLHVTLAVSWPTNFDLFSAALFELALERGELRRALGPELQQEFGDLVACFPESILARARERLVARPIGGRPGLARPGSLAALALDTHLCLRAGVELGYHAQPHRVLLSAGVRDYPLPRRVLPYVEHICGTRRFRIGDLPDGLPGNSKLSFARWLMSRGLVEILAAT